MTRNIFTVTTQIIRCLPPGNEEATRLLGTLNSFIYNLSFIPPERLHDVLLFNQLLKILMEHFGRTPPTNGWRKDVYDTWMGKK